MIDISRLVIRALDPEASLAEQHEAFAELVRAYQNAAFACAFSSLRDFELAEDAAQEAFIAAWRKLSHLREPAAFPGWLRRIVLSECNRAVRGKRTTVLPLSEVGEIPSTQCDPHTNLEHNTQMNAVLTAVGQLPRNERLVVSLFYVNGNSHKETAAFLGVPVTTVAKRLYAARARMKRTLTKEFREVIVNHRPSHSRTFVEKVRAGIFDEYVGEYRYETRPDLTVVIKKDEDRLIGEANGQINELIADGDSEIELRTKEFDGLGRFSKDKNGRVTHFVYFESGKEMGIARKIDPVAKTR